MLELSVIIPARNEKYLQNTIDDILKNAGVEDMEVIVGLDNYWPVPPLKEHPKVKVYHAEKRIGMRPMINRLAKIATGKYMMKIDAHCIFDNGYARKLIDIVKPGYTVLGIRYELDVEKWERRKKTGCDFRYLSHPDVDKRGGLRGIIWNKYKKKVKGQKVVPSMTLSGSAWLMSKVQWDVWNGLDENHGTFAQEGCEIACKTWLGGGQLLINRQTWYAHWNRGKAPYSLGQNQRTKSINYSIDYWLNDKWPLQKYSFYWLINKFAPVPGWDKLDSTTVKPIKALKPIKARNQGTLYKGVRKLNVDELWERRIGISEPLKKWRLKLLFDTLYDMFFELNQGKEYTSKEMRKTRYYWYLGTHLQKNNCSEIQPRLMRKWRSHLDKKFIDAVNLFHSIKKNGLYHPLEFYNDGDKMFLWKGYRRLCALKVLGYKDVPACVHLHKGLKSMPRHFSAIIQPDSIDELGKKQFVEYGWKATDKYWVHGYTQIYDQLFAHLRNKKLKILEFGILRGASLKLWHDAFPKAMIYGVDKRDGKHKEFTEGYDRIKVLIGKQQDKTFLNEVKKHGPFHIIIDDCSHDPVYQLNLFDSMFQSVSKAGYYIIEDAYRSFLPAYDTNTVGQIANLTENIYTNQKILSLQFFYNMCVIQKGI